MADADRPGIKTSEFWLSLIAITISAVLSSGILPDGHLAVQSLGVALTILAALGYTASRTLVKKIDPAPEAPAPAPPGTSEA